jgi:hypothetical protein
MMTKSTSSSSLQFYQNQKSKLKQDSVKKLHQQKYSKQGELKRGLLYQPNIKKPSSKILSQSSKKEKERKSNLKKLLKSNNNNNQNKINNKTHAAMNKTPQQYNVVGKELINN